MTYRPLKFGLQCLIAGCETALEEDDITKIRIKRVNVVFGIVDKTPAIGSDVGDCKRLRASNRLFESCAPLQCVWQLQVSRKGIDRLGGIRRRWRWREVQLGRGERQR